MGQDNTKLLFGLSAVLFFIHQYIQKIEKVNIPILDSYLDPLLFMPILLYLIALERRLILQEPAYRLSVKQIFGYFIIIAVAGEVVFPTLSNRFTADILDVVFYALGGGVYIMAQGSRQSAKPEC